MLSTNLRADLNHLLSFNHLKRPSRSISFFGFGKKKDESPEIESQDLVEKSESMWQHLSEEEIEKIQNKSNLTTKERDRFREKLSNPIRLTELYQYKTDYVRNLYATFGRESGLKPGVCWPRKSELEFKRKYEETFFPSFEQLMKELNEERAKEKKEREERNEEIRKGFKKLKKYKKEFFERYDKKQSEIKAKEDKEAKRIEEITDFLGYSLNPNDPRFEIAAAKKEEKDRLEMSKTGAVKKTRQQKMLEDLQKLIEQNQEAEQASSKKEAKDDEQINEIDKETKNKEKKSKKNKSELDNENEN